MRATALSDDNVINTVNEFCVATTLNVTTDGFPVDELPALKFVESIYQSDWRTEFGFASCLMFDPEGKMILGSSALVDTAEERADPSLTFSGERFLRFIVRSLERYDKMRQIRQLPPLMRIKPWAEILNDMRLEIQKSIESSFDLQNLLK